MKAAIRSDEIRHPAGRECSGEISLTIPVDNSPSLSQRTVLFPARRLPEEAPLRTMASGVGRRDSSHRQRGCAVTCPFPPRARRTASKPIAYRPASCH